MLASLIGACSTSSDGSDPYDTEPSLAAETNNSAGEQGDGDPSEADTDEAGMTLDLGDPGDALECDVWAQDCPAGEKCSWEIVDELFWPRCVPLADEARTPGEPCTMFGDPGSGHDDCELGAICSWLNGNNEGVCLALCSGSPIEPSCEGAGLPALCQPCSDCPSLCVPTCDPLAQDCGPGYACTPNSGDFTCTPVANVGDGALADPCEYSLQCQAGFACIDGALIPGCNGVGCCSPFCHLDDPVCPQDLICEPWFEGPEPGSLPHVGVCESI